MKPRRARRLAAPRRRAVLAALFVLVAAGCRSSSEIPPPPARIAATPHVDSLDIASASMGRTVRVVVATPGTAPRPWPSVTLLHGHGGDAANWARRLGPGGLEATAARYGTLIACPDGGADSWYLDSPNDPSVRMETFLAAELPAALAARYDVRTDRAGRAITGLSMGGHGALFVALRHRDAYGAAASMSGGVDLAQFPERWGKARHLGPWPADSSVWLAHSVLRLAATADTAALPRMMVDIGVDDFFLGPNRALHETLTRRGIAHDYAERPGGHTWAYWTRALPVHLAFFREGFDAPR